MRVLITGATGFIGRHCVQVLCAHGHEVHAVGRRRIEDGNADVTWHALDLLEPSTVQDLVSRIRPTHLLHLAWFTAPKAYWTAPENLQWVGVSLELLRAFTAYGGERALLVGSCAEYEWAHEVYSERNTPCKPDTLYGMCKHSLNTLASFYAAQAGLSYAWARIFFLYGPHENSARLAASVINALLDKERASCSPGTQARDFLHVEDAARALVQLLESDVQGAVNIGSGHAIPVRELVSRIGVKLGKSNLLDFGALPAPAHEPPVICADTERLTAEVKWAPSYDLDEGLEQTIAWWQEKRNAITYHN